MLVPPRFHSGGDLGQHLHDLPAGDRGGHVLELGALELAGEVVARLRVRHQVRLPDSRGSASSMA
jgi:hypothetical protein